MRTKTTSTTAVRITCLTTSIIGLLLFASLPASASPPAPSDLLDHQLERVENEVASWVDDAPTAEAKQRLLRHVRYLHHLVLKKGADQDMVQRVENLEFQVRTGASRTLVRLGGSAKNLDKVGSVTGTVTRSSDGSPLANIEVQLRSEGHIFWDSDNTDVSGQYHLTPPEPGDYFVITYNSQGFLDELYDDVRCPYFEATGCGPSDATPITVAEQGTVRADFALDLGGSISGAVTNATTGEPNQYMEVVLWTEEGDQFAYENTDSQGRFLFDQLAPGSYYASTRSFDTYLDELFDNEPCPFSHECDFSAGTPISVTLGSTTAGVDFALDEYGKISGRAIDGLTGEPVPYQEFYAVNAQGSSVGSGGTDADGRYIIGGLSDGAHYVRTGYPSWGFDPQLYEGVPCPDATCDPTEGSPVNVQLNETTTGIDFILEGGCIESDTRMCLNDNRFLVESTWRTGSGNAGQGFVRELTEDSGYFWFFGADNVEIVVKVLDACTFPGANNFWVFAGGLTQVEVTLTVTDTQTGAVRTYVNPLGTPFQPIQDTSAFDTCP